ncbi:MAG: DHH family phosphoesterase [Clostridia bacterium]|nr:DHH family phosphoesterase [Clostridia bacterium]
MSKKFSKIDNFNMQDVAFFCEQNLPLSFAKVLSQKGFTAENFWQFLSGEKFHDPYEMYSMKEAVALVKSAMTGTILICGDYDADGLTATAILHNYFKANGVDCHTLIPTREQGYGLHLESIEQKLAQCNYSLIITVDCGISEKETIEFLQQKYNVSILVTDHHELPENLPNCVCLNPKLGYPYPLLSGAGVAFKLVEALTNLHTAKLYADLACVGTIADLMPILDENRSIVLAGLNNLNNVGLKKLAQASRCNNPLTANDVAMRIAPKINAAGRVQSPLVALDLLCNDSMDALEQLFVLNDVRKTLSDEMLEFANKNFNLAQQSKERLIFVYGTGFKHGVIGIVANNLKTQYNVPCVALTQDGDNFVGSARGIDGINLFQLFDNASHLLVKFGGHSGSVGFTVSKENLLPLQNHLKNQLKHVNSSVFKGVNSYDLEMEKDVDFQAYCALADLVRPALPSDEVVFYLKTTAISARLFGKESEHLEIITSFGLRLVYFYGKQYFDALSSGAEAEFTFTLEKDNFYKSYCGVVNAVKIDNSLHFDKLYKLNYINNLSQESRQFITERQFLNTIAQENVTLVVDTFDTYQNLSKQFDLSQFEVNYFTEVSSCGKQVLVSPKEVKFDALENVVVIDGNDLYAKWCDNAKYFALNSNDWLLSSVSLNRDLCVLVFGVLKKKSRFDSLDDCYEKYLLSKMDHVTFRMCIKVFEELHLVEIESKYQIKISSIKVDLSDSSIFTHFTK